MDEVTFLQGLIVQKLSKQCGQYEWKMSVGGLTVAGDVWLESGQADSLRRHQIPFEPANQQHNTHREQDTKHIKPFCFDYDQRMRAIITKQGYPDSVYCSKCYYAREQYCWHNDVVDYLPPVRVVLVTDLQDVSLFKPESERLTGNLVVCLGRVVEVCTHVFLWEEG